MPRTVPGRGVGQEGVRVPDALRHMAGLPIVAGGAVATGPTGQWRDVALARNLAWVADGMGTQFGMAWRGTALTGALANTMRVRLPVPSASHARVRLRVWATGSAGATITLASATVGPTALVVGAGPFGRYPAPGADLIIDAGADVVVDADAGPYVDLVLVTSGSWGKLESVHLDLVEAGAPASYPTANTTLAAGAVADFVPADTDDYAAGLPLGSDTLFEHLAQWPAQWDRRKVALSWAEFNRVGGGLPPRRMHCVVRVAPGARTRITVAAYFPVVSMGTVIRVMRFSRDPAAGGQPLVFMRVLAAAAAGWQMLTTDVLLDDVALGSPAQGVAAFESLHVQVQGALPSSAAGGVGDISQVALPSPTRDVVQSVTVWVG